MREARAGRSQSRIRSRHVYGVFIFIMFFAPFAFGSVEPWSLALMQSLVFLALVMLLYKKHITGGQLYRVPGAVPLLALLGFMAFQALPLPQALVGLLSPETLKIYQSTALVLQPDMWVSLSLDREATVMEFLRYASCAVFYALAVQLMAKSKRYGKLTRAMSLVAAALAFVGIMTVIAGNGNVLWIREAPSLAYKSVGPYLNKNHYANIMAMLLPVVFGLFIALRPRVTRQGTLREMFSEIFGSRKINRHLIMGLITVLVGIAILMSLSRGGIISAAIGVMLFGLLYFKYDPKVGVPIVALIVLCAALMGWFGWQPLMDRLLAFGNTGSMSVAGRMSIWSDVMEMVRDFPLFGVGFGAMYAAYPAYRTLEGRVPVDHAHNDYIEFLSEGGAIAALLALLFIGRVLYVSIGGMRKRHDSRATVLAISALSAIAVMFAHGAVDFSMHVGANALYFFLMLALLVSASHVGDANKADGKTKLIPCGPHVAGRAYAVSVAGLLVTIAFGVSSVMGGYWLSGLNHVSEVDQKIIMAKKARMMNPLDSKIRYALALAHMNELDFESATLEIVSSLRLAPTEGRLLQAAAQLLLGQGKSKQAETLLRSAQKYGSRWSESAAVYAGWLLSAGRKDEALAVVSQVMSDEPRRAGRYMDFAVGRGLDIEELIPYMSGEKKAIASIALSLKLVKAGRAEAAGKLIDEAMRKLEIEADKRAVDYLNAARVYRQLGKQARVLASLDMGATHFPNDINLALVRASGYEQGGEIKMAITEYERALRIDAANQRAYNALKRLRKLYK